MSTKLPFCAESHELLPFPHEESIGLIQQSASVCGAKLALRPTRHAGLYLTYNSYCPFLHTHISRDNFGYGTTPGRPSAPAADGPLFQI
ncbi:hypothetical protein J6590_023613 [Homalodisca vitripennis]|nr:hypothetical protein J6590_023613 [Homalodisca vitripennis]